jgi:MFS transporter, BCD family, chlorophyll transporter
LEDGDVVGLNWPAIFRLGLVQSALGAIVMLSSSLLNRVMVVEFALPAMVPAALVAWHYGVQMSRPKWGHSSDLGHRRAPWIIGGMSLLALGGLLATDAMIMTQAVPTLALILLVIAYTMIGFGVGAAGTSLLALIASQVAPERRPAAASLAWIMMVLGIVVTAGVSGAMLDPFTPQRLALVAGSVVLVSFVLTLVALYGVEKRALMPETPDTEPPVAFKDAMATIWADPPARKLTIFVFVSMLAYSAQDLILEPFAGLVFNYTPGQSTQLSSVQHMGVLLGMILIGVAGNAFGGSSGFKMRRWIMLGCIGSAIALAMLAASAIVGPTWPLRPTVFALGFGNGVFAVSAIAAMMELAGGGAKRQEGARMGLWGAAQAVAFAIGGFAGAGGVDIGRAIFGNSGQAFVSVFALEAALFLVAAWLAASLGSATAQAEAKANFSRAAA